MSPRHFAHMRLVPLALPLALFLLPGAAFAQQSPVTPPQPSRSGAPASAASTLFSMNLKATPLREALVSLFTNAHAQYSLADDVPNTPITLSMNDQPLLNVLRQILEQGSSAHQRLTFTIESDVYRIKAVAVDDQPMTTSLIQLVAARPADVAPRLQMVFPDSMILTNNQAPSLIVRASEAKTQEIQEMARLMDVNARPVVITAEVVLIAEQGTPGLPKSGSAEKTKTTTDAPIPIPMPVGTHGSALLSTTLRTLSGLEATGDDKLLGTPEHTARLGLTTTPTALGDGSYQLETKWEVSLPLPTGKTAAAGGKSNGGLVRLEKRLTNTAQMRSGETVVVGGVTLSQYGLKGEILFFVTLTNAAN